MKIEMLRTPSKVFGCCLKEGDIGNVEADVGKALIAAGIAVCRDIKPEAAPAEIKAVEPEVVSEVTPEVKPVGRKGR